MAVPRVDGSVSDATHSVWLLGTLLVLALAFSVIYVPEVGHGFIKDDFEWIAHSRIGSWSELGQAFRRAPSGFFRPMVSVSFALDRHVCGLDARCYGLTNVLLALGCAGGVFALALALSVPKYAALLAAAVWAFNWHGVNVALMWISGRTALVVVLFATLTAVAFVRRRFWVASILLFLTLLSKEEAVLLPGVLIVWAVGSAIARRVSWRPIAPFVVGSAIAEGVYFLLRSQSGAFTPSTAPSFYQFSLTVGTLVSNAGQYLDRTSTFAGVIMLLWFIGARPKCTRMTAELWAVVALGVLWWLGALAITVFLPVRSSLYSCLPSVGVALVASALVHASSSTLSSAACRRTIVVLTVTPFVMWPVYHARNGPLRREAELSTSTLTALQMVATERGADAVVIVHDDRSSKPSLINPFGGFLQDAADLTVRPKIHVWLDPPPAETEPRNLTPPSRVDAELSLERGSIVRVH
jgi:hypothetical protein